LRRLSPAQLFPPRRRGRIRYDTPTSSAEPARRNEANPDTLPPMAKRKASASRPERRPREEIDRNYFFGDVLIKTGVAVGVALALIAAFTPFSLATAYHDRMYAYLAVMGLFAVIGMACFLYGRHLRREATHWDFD
jgi:hypothetical protein